MKKALYILLILLLSSYSCSNVETSEKLEKENWLYSNCNYPLSDALRNKLNELSFPNPDSVIKITTEILNDYPYSREILYYRMSAYLGLENYSKCKEDLIKIIIIDSPHNESNGLLGILDYLNCKITTDGDCGDSIFLRENLYTFDFSDDFLNNNEVKDTQDYDYIIE